MNPFDLSQIPTVSEAPEETPEDLMRQQMMQRLGATMNPQAAAQAAAAQRLGQGGSGVKGWLERILGGAAEGLRYSQDPKYRGVYQEELGRAQEQEKNMLPYARQLEASSAQRYKARMDAQEKERATAAKVFATLKLDAQMKVKNQNDRAKIDQDIAKSEAQIADLQTKGKFTEARTELQKLQNKLFEKIGRTQATNAASDAAVLQGVDKFTDMTGDQAYQGMASASKAKALGPAMVAAIRALSGGRGSGSTSQSTSTRFLPGGEDMMGRPTYIPTPVTNTTVRSGGGGGDTAAPAISNILQSMGASKDVLQPFSGAEAGQPPANITAPTPESRGATALGITPKSKPIATPPPVGSASAPVQAPKVITGPGFRTGAARQEFLTDTKVVGLTQDIRSNLGTKVADIADGMGRVRGHNFTLELLNYGKALSTVPEFKKAYTEMIADMMQNRVEERLLKTGKASNMTEMGEISRYMPNINDTFQDALIKSTRLEILGKLALERKDRNYSAPFQPGRLGLISDKIFKLYRRALEQKDPKERREMLKNIEKITDPKNLWELATDPDAEDFLK